MTVLVLGSTGLLGQAMVKALHGRGHHVVEAARRGAELALDIGDTDALEAALHAVAPRLVINCAALADIDACEKDPDLAWRVNARPLAFLAGWSRAFDRPLIHTSTDQFFVTGGSAPHDEQASVTLVNEYARTKFCGEALALTAPKALVLRTSIVGVRGWTRLTFAEWALAVVEGDLDAKLFSDAYTSSIDVASFSDLAQDLVDRGACGLYNLAASEVYSKEQFVHEMARQLGKMLSRAVGASVASMTVPRANCLGLNVTRAQQRLDRRLPTLKDVVASVIAQKYRHDLT